MSESDGVTVIGLLGPIAVGSGTEPEGLTAVPGVRARRLLVSLALADGRTRSVDRLIDDVWPDSRPRSPMPALHTQVSRLRQLVGPGRLEGVGGGYRLVGCRTDIDIVDDLTQSNDHDDLDRAERWWRGTPGDDIGSDASGLDTELHGRAERLRAVLDERRTHAALMAGDHALARSLAERRCRADPLDESAHIDLMHALAGEGRIPDAHAVFARLRRALSEQLGVDPSPRVVALNAELLDRSDDGAESVTRPSGPPRARTVGLTDDASELIGRDNDVAAIIDLFEHRRLVTIQGPGGVGKTRVARRVGESMADAGRPVFYVPLAPIRDGDDVVVAIAGALGVGETEIGPGGRPRLAAGDLADRLLDAVRGQPAVLILDNCEQVIDRCASLSADLLAAEPQLSILTTSRAPLMLAAEQIYQLPVLDVGEHGAAVELFERRASAVRPNARLRRDEVAELCRRLDGLPLAIELAAARIRTMSVGEISQRLAERFALLRGTDRSLPDRHRTLYAVIEWSWDLLDPESRSAMRRLCRFPAGFTADTAAEVVGRGGLGLVDTLEALVNQSLLTVVETSGQVRYRMLEMVREFGEHMLTGAKDSEESDAVDRAMWRWARGFADHIEAQFDVAVDATLLESIAPEVDNLVWVLRRSLAAVSDSASDRDSEAVDTVVTVFPVLAGFWVTRGLHGEFMTWGNRLLYTLPRPPADLDSTMRRRWQVTILASVAHLMMLGQDLRAPAIGRFYIRLLHRPSYVLDEPAEFVSACLLSRTPVAGLRYIVRATGSPNHEVRVAALAIRMSIGENVGLLDRALADAFELSDIARRTHNAWLAAMSRVTLASGLGQRAQWASAEEHYRAGIAELVALDARDEVAQTRGYLVATLVALGRLDEAADELALLTDGWQSTDPDPHGNPEVIGGMMLCFAELEYARGHTGAAADLFWRGGTLVGREHPLGAQDPGMALLVSASTAGLVRAGDLPRAHESLRVLVDSVDTVISGPPRLWFDGPVAGAVALAAGYLLCVTEPSGSDGPRLMACGRRLGARQDYPALHFAYTRMATISGVPAQQWESLLNEVNRLPRRQVADEVRTILAPRRTAAC